MTSVRYAYGFDEADDWIFGLEEEYDCLPPPDVARSRSTLPSSTLTETLKQTSTTLTVT